MYCIIQIILEFYNVENSSITQNAFVKHTLKNSYPGLSTTMHKLFIIYQTHLIYYVRVFYTT